MAGRSAQNGGSRDSSIGCEVVVGWEKARSQATRRALHIDGISVMRTPWKNYYWDSGR
jgi:hypothetical protein